MPSPPLLQSEDGSSVHRLSAWPLTSIPCVNRRNKQNEGRERGKGDKGARYAPPPPPPGQEGAGEKNADAEATAAAAAGAGEEASAAHACVCAAAAFSSLTICIQNTRLLSCGGGGWGWGGRMSRCSCPAGGRARMDEPSEQRCSQKTFSLITRACRKHTHRQRLRQQAASLNKHLLINIKSASTNKHLSCLFPQMIPSRFLHVQTEHPGRCCLISALQSE